MAWESLTELDVFPLVRVFRCRTRDVPAGFLAILDIMKFYDKMPRIVFETVKELLYFIGLPNREHRPISMRGAITYV